MEKLAFALVTVARKLKSYFQTHTMVVLTDKPLQRVMSNPEAIGQMALWAIELSEFDIQYSPRTVVKGQVVVDFIAEFTNVEGQGAEEYPQWIIHTDGSSNRQAGGAGIMIHSLEGDKIKCMVHLDFLTTNNETKYKVLVAGLDLAKAVRAISMMVSCNSQVIMSQVNDDYECKGERMKKDLEQVKKQVGNDVQAKFVQIPKEENKQVD